MNRQQFISGSIVAAVAVLHRRSFADDSAGNSFPYSIADVQNNLITINIQIGTKKKKCCGFVVLFENKPYLITNQRFILGSDRISFSSPVDRTIKPRSIELAENCDLVRMALTEGDGFKMATDSEMGERVAVFSSNQSEDSEDSVFGKINGVGADIIEVTAEFGEGNSGSPVLNQNKEALGIASYSWESRSHIMKKGTRFENRTRRFCLRLNTAKWQPVNWKTFNKKFGKAYSRSNVLIDDVITVLNSWADGPLDKVSFENKPNKTMAGWLESHNQIVSHAVDTGKGRREFYSSYSESAEQLARLCEIQAQKLNVLLEQRGLTDFIANQLDEQAATLEMAADVIKRYGASTY